ncbi:oxidoreductase [Halovenus sp. WSH3]|uniref:phosphoglycerol geranylgeranyltransferase n=1 Tax=Halovenus carboxidivorans TaxID=2692199 RepID=A0A6B0TDX3_9EURY|nr:geranylgeranylglyceryl/heptaprenylglyceryl phosphate synthase [Halovenus carboxidivorans]MXR51399.1 oxidoreductase [Halovenus carboxidivorans]
MSLTQFAKRFESAASLLSIAGRTLLGLETNPVPGEWTHITKVDPEGEKRLPLLFPSYLSHTSAVSVGGSQDVTDENTEQTFELLTDSGVTAFHEPSEATHVTEKTRDHANFLAVPEVLNGDSESLVGTLGKGIDYVREDLGPEILEQKTGLPLSEFLGDRAGDFVAGMMMDEAVFEAYIIMNVDSAAAREANVTEEDLLSPQEAKERALAAQHHLESEIIYLEYSGTFGGDEAVEMLEAIDDGVTWSQIWYGGGLDNSENAQRVLDAGADAVVVGDAFHRVAELEAELFDRAREEFDGDASAEQLQSWVDETVDIEDSEAVNYLSTIPEVTEPEQRAIEYLAAGLEFGLAVADVAEELSDPTPSEIRTAVSDRQFAVESTFRAIPGADANGMVEEFAGGLLADHFDLEMPERAVAAHFGIDL